MANRSNRGWGEAAVGSSATKRDDLYGLSSADFIRASGHANRVKQAGHMSAPDRTRRTSKNLASTGPSTHEPRELLQL